MQYVTDCQKKPWTSLSALVFFRAASLEAIIFKQAYARSTANCLHGLNLVFQVPLYRPNSPVLGGLRLALGHGSNLMLVKFCKTISLDPNNSAAMLDADLLSHRLRKGFRAAFCYNKWQDTNRNDGGMCREVPYSEMSCQATRKLSSDNAHAFATMTGGYVSQTSLHNRTGLPITCPCGQMQLCNMRYGSAHVCRTFWTDLARLQTPF